MHESHLAQSVVKSVIEKTGKMDDLERISRVIVTVGTLKMVTPESFTKAFQDASAGTICEGASLTVRTVQGDTLTVDSIEAEYKEKS